VPHLIGTHVDELAQRSAKTNPPFGPGLPADIVEKIVKLEMWGSSFKDPGADWCEFRAFNAEGEKIAERRVAGY